MACLLWTRTARKTYPNLDAAIVGAFMDIERIRRLCSEADELLGSRTYANVGSTGSLDFLKQSPSNGISNRYYRKILRMGSWQNVSWAPRF